MTFPRAKKNWLGPAIALLAGVALATGAVVQNTHQASAAAPKQATAASNITRATLPNGLKVILVRNTLAPVVATSVNYIIGSNETPAGFPGMAHAMEHMMFRGSPGLTADQLAAIGSVMGGNFNANTRENLTQYLFTVPAEDLDVALHIEAIRMQAIEATDKDWDQERGAIEQEVAQDISNPGYLLFQRLREVLFKGTPYEHDALGTRPSFDKTTAAMLKDFHDTWYAPNNAVLVVAGNLDPQATLAKIRELFGPLKAKKLPARSPINPQPAVAESFTMETDRPNGAQILAIRMPGLDSPDFPALEVLSDVLSSERSALYGLVPEGKALATSFDLEPLQKIGMAYATIAFPADGDPKQAEKDLRDVLAKIVKDGIPADLVEAAKMQEKRQAEFSKNSISGLASIWSEAVAVYGLNSPDDDLTRILKVSVADVNRVAKKYLDFTNAVSATMIPKEGGRPVAGGGGGFGGQEEIALGEAGPTELPDWARAALDRLDVPPSTIHPVVSTLPNGITLIVQPEDVSDTISLYGHIKTRPELHVAAGKEGLTQIMGQLFDYGSETLDRIAFQEELDKIGASESAGTDFSVGVLSQDFDRGVQLLADNQLHPAFPEMALNIIKRQVGQVVAARLKSPAYLAQRSLREALVPAEDPTLRDATPETVTSLTTDDVRNYYKMAFRPDLTTMVVIGRVTPEQARATVEKYFGGWQATGPKPPVDLPSIPDNKAGTFAVPDASRVQDSVTLAETVSITRSHPDYYALQLGSAVLGGSFYSTRLSRDLRKNYGLVYSVGSDVTAGKTRGNYFVSYACDPENVTKAHNIVVQELKAMQDTPVPVDELARVKALMLRQIPLGEASLGRIAQGLAGRWDLDLPLDEPTRAAQRYIALTPAEVQAAFKKWVRPDDLVRVTQGPTPQ